MAKAFATVGAIGIVGGILVGYKASRDYEGAFDSGDCTTVGGLGVRNPHGAATTERAYYVTAPRIGGATVAPVVGERSAGFVVGATW